MKGSAEYTEEKSIDWIDHYFGKYTLGGLDSILSLRLKDLELEDISIMQGMFIDRDHNNITNLLSDVMNTTAQTILVPLNLFNKHATGLIFEKTNNSSIQVKYLDPENKAIPAQLEQIFRNCGLNIEQLNVEQQKYSNCGPEVIEGFIFYLTGERLSQEEAIPFHSELVEHNLFCGAYGNYDETYIQLAGRDMDSYL